MGLSYSLLFIIFSLMSCTQIDHLPTDLAGYNLQETKFLEDPLHPKALSWVHIQSDKTRQYLQSDPTYAPLKHILNQANFNPDKQPSIGLYNGYIWQYWDDAHNPIGVWRRTSLKSYRSKKPKWENLIDFDQLSKTMGQKILFRGACPCRQDPNKYLISLSFGGKDESIVREWDLVSRHFVLGGFETKKKDGTWIEEKLIRSLWIDKDTVLITFAKDSSTDLTDSGYARNLYIWKRGIPIESANKIHTISPQDIWISLGYTCGNPDESPDLFLSVWHDFYHHTTYAIDTSSYYVRNIHIPDDALFYGDFRKNNFLYLKSDWTIQGRTYLKGSVVSLTLKECYIPDSDKKGVRLIFEPKPHLSFSNLCITRDEVFMTVLNHVKPEVFHFTWDKNHWTLPRPITLSEPISDVDLRTSWKDKEVILNLQSFVQPMAQYEWSPEKQILTHLKSSESFPSKKYTVEQAFATSRDGTKIPYFLVHPKNMIFNGKNPTILYGYGGFRISQTPFYSRSLAHAWLEQGGVFVLANIRGGEEYGPSWHEAVKGAKRQNTFDDFISIAEDIIRRGIASPKSLSIRGESNGGLLVSVAMTQRPDLFRSVVCKYPILDMERYTSFGAGASWIDEYGDPSDPDALSYLQKYAPLRHIQLDQHYPELLLLSSCDDQRTHPWHARIMKWVMDKNMHSQAWYFEKNSTGHGCDVDLRDALETETYIYTFLAKTLGLKVLKTK